MIHMPVSELHPVFNTWLFVQEGLDIVRPINKDLENKRILSVTIYCFIKWIEVRVVASIKTHDVCVFIWEDIIW